MDSRDLFNTSKRLIHKVNWEYEYYHIGQSPNKDVKTLVRLISDYFQTTKVHLILDRQNSRTISLTELELLLQTLDDNYVLWNEHFISSIDHKSIGVYRKGRII
ncbi:hypothetical protein [Sediminitomix flava]|uniref:Uncharacterized protein n=1 Tax=Sediminitomix flava TaxID=379075 RepID=A0A315Z608_SEDFL|nr:hypothetical protein [Sediminitomix flava]PWJ38649.1 hypothetical protein BC781_107240 [Sediminitomix flava]